MNKCPKYSVIIPVYNAAATLPRCVDSLLNQDYADAEIILVNDGSKDDSGAICSAYETQSEFVVYVEKNNGGVSTARNAGLAVARGEYVLFVDSDDYVSPQYFATLDILCAEKEYDCVFFSHTVVKGQTSIRKSLKPFATVEMKHAVPKFCEAFYLKYLTPPFNKRYTRSIIEENKIRFPEHLYVGEDKSFSLQYVMCCKSCLISPELLYFLSLDNENSLSRKFRPDLHQQLQMVDDQMQLIIRNAQIPEEYRQQFYSAEKLLQLRAIYSESKRMHLAGRNVKFRRRLIRQMCDNNNKQKADLPSGMFSALLQIPVRLRLVSVIDLMGWYLAR